MIDGGFCLYDGLNVFFCVEEGDEEKDEVDDGLDCYGDLLVVLVCGVFGEVGDEW